MSTVQADGHGEEVVHEETLPSNVIQFRHFKYFKVKSESKEEREARQLAERKAHNEKVTQDYKLKRD